MPMRFFVLSCISAVISVSDAQNAADTAWQHLQELNTKIGEKVPIGINAAEFYAVRGKMLHDAAVDFVKQFPNDLNEPEAMLWKIATTDFPESTELRMALIRENELDGKTIINNPTLPASLRYDVQRIILTQWLDNPDLITAPDQAANLEERIASLIQKNPAEPRIISFQLARAGLLLRFDHAKGMALLEDLMKAADQYFDGKGWETELATKYSVRAIPEMWLINQEGAVISTEVPIEQLDQKIGELLGAGDKLSRN